MFRSFALASLAIISPVPAEEPGLPIATDRELSTSVRLFETDDAVRFQFTGPDSIAANIAIDTNRNGVVDRNVDFQVGFEPGDSPCFQLLLGERSSTTCRPVGDKMKVMQSRGQQATITDVIFPKREVSGDGFGFGFSVKLCSTTGNFCNSLAGGDYRFGGKLSLVTDGPTFNGDKKPDIPEPILPALRRYQGCVNKALDSLSPLDRSKGAQMRALPATCAAERSIALDEGVKALVASGTEREEAAETMRSWLDGYDDGILRMAETIEKGA